MPALPAVPKTLRVDLRQQAAEDLDILNRIFIQYTGTAPTVGDLNTFCSTIETSWGAHVKAMQSGNFMLAEVHVEDLSSSTAAAADLAASVTGTRSGAAITAGVAAVIRNRIARRYRGGHSRTYLACGTGGDLNDLQSWTGAFMTALETAWGDFILDIISAPWSGGGTLTQVNVSYYSGFHNVVGPSGRSRPVPTLRGTPVTDTIVSYTINPHVGSQRRRNQQ